MYLPAGCRKCGYDATPSRERGVADSFRPVVSRESKERAVPPGQKALRLSTTPHYSLVIASTGSRASLEACLAALGPVCAERQVELVVARATEPAELLSLQEAYDNVLFMPAPDGSSMAQLKTFGLAAAEGDIVVFATDDQRDPAWVREATLLAG